MDRNLKIRLRNRPWKLLFGTIFFVLATIILGVDLLDGQVSLRKYGTMDFETRPGAFTIYVVLYLLNCGITVISWMVLRHEWSSNYLPPFKPGLHDPDKVRHYRSDN